MYRLKVSMNNVSQSLASTASAPAPLALGSAMEYRIEPSSQRPESSWRMFTLNIAGNPAKNT
jgi:hypothetical protein